MRPPGASMFSRCKALAHIEHGEIVGSQLLRIQQYANLPRLAALQIDATHAVDRLNRPPHLLVGDFGQLAHGVIGPLTSMVMIGSDCGSCFGDNRR